MNTTASTTPQQPTRLERSYNAKVEDLWFLWTTKEGFESWWGPEGFRVEVRKLDLRVEGDLVYDMIADAPQQIAFMKANNMPLSQGVRGTYTAIALLKHLELTQTIDFIPGVAPYDNKMLAEFFQEPGGVARMVITVEPHLDALWTERATAGMTSQLTKVEAALARRAGK
jgi:uncharacterized protein YndB with AHSA1/START domain